MKNRKLRKITFIILISPFVLILLTYSILFITTPISRSNKSVREYVLDTIPLGTSYNDTTEIINSHDKWKFKYEYIDHGLILHDNYQAIDLSKSYIEEQDIDVIGEKMICIKLGEYYSPFYTVTFAYLAFNETDELIEVGIIRDVDAFW